MIYGQPVTLGGASGEITITSDGNYDVKKYATANVDVVSLGTRSITANGTYDVKKYATANVNVAPVLLWTNASPNSSFGEQEVTLVKGFSSYIIEFETHYPGATPGTVFNYKSYCPLSANGYRVYCGQIPLDYAGYGEVHRKLSSVADGSIVFGTGGGSSEDNRVAIPLRIWGVKFAVE